jgi:hypothetical protein
MMLAVDILQLMPGFTQGSNTLHNILIGACFVLCFAGLLLLANQGFREQSVKGILPALVRLAVVVILVGGLSGFGNLLMSGVNDIISQMGLNSVSGGIFEAYRAAVAQKFGSDGAGQPSAAKQAPQQNAQPGSGTMPPSEGDTSGGFTPTTAGIQLTHYGYERPAAAAIGTPGTPEYVPARPADPDYDPNSWNGIGAFNFDTAPHSLVPLQSAALSPDVVQAYNLQPGQSFTATAGGQTYNLVFADKTSDALTGRVDIYDPQQTLGDSQLVGVDSLNGGPVTQGNGGFLGGWISKIGDSLTVGLLYPLVHLLSLIALGIMWLMQAVQQIVYTIEIAVSPIFLGFLMIPRLVGTATKFLCSLASITLWGLGWAVADLLTRALIAFAVNPTNNLAQTPFSASSMMLGYWVVLALWVIGSSFIAPLVVSGMLMAGSSGISALFGATVGAAAMTAIRTSGAASHAVGATAAAAAAPISLASHSAMNAYRSFARRPSTPAPTGNGNGSS